MSVSEPAHEATSELVCLMLPLQTEQLLVPHTCVSEVLPWRQLDWMDGLPPWCPGTLLWRGERLAVIDAEELIQQGSESQASAGETGARALVVVKGRVSQDLPDFYAFTAAGLPRLLHLTEDEVSARSESLTGSELAMPVLVGVEEAFVPDLEAMQKLAAEII